MSTPCKHPKEDTIIAVVEVLVTCETTMVFCKKCETFLTPPETHC